MMINKNVERVPLDFNSYEKYQIDQRYSAFKITVAGLTQEECDDFEYNYLQQGYKLFHSEIHREQAGALRLVMILAKLESTR